MKGVTQKAKQAFGAGGGGGSDTKITNIVEDIDVGVPIRVVYNQWTQFADFPGFMKKVESAEQKSEEKVNWKAQIVWSHRTWESTIKDQIPDERIVWESKGTKGHVDGTVTFHELAPNLTRIMLVLEHHPQGFFERTGNIWRAQGRRVRLELKHFRRHVMTQTILEPDEVEGWRGEIRDSEVVRSHEEVLADEQAQSADEDGELADEEDYGDEDSGEEDYGDEGYGDEEAEYAGEDYEREPQPS